MRPATSIREVSSEGGRPRTGNRGRHKNTARGPIIADIQKHAGQPARGNTGDRESTRHVLKLDACS